MYPDLQTRHLYNVGGQITLQAVELMMVNTPPEHWKDSIKALRTTLDEATKQTEAESHQAVAERTKTRLSRGAEGMPLPSQTNNFWEDPSTIGTL